MYLSSLNKYTVKYFLDYFVVHHRKRGRKGASTCALLRYVRENSLAYQKSDRCKRKREREVRVKVDQYDDAYERLTRLVAYEWSLHPKVVSYARRENARAE